MGNLHLDAGTTWNKGSLLDEGTDNTEGIMEGSVSFVEDETVGTSQKEGDSLSLVGASSDLNDLGLTTTGGNFVDEVGSSELLGLELVNVSNGGGVDSSGDEINLVSVNILDNHDVLLGEEMEGKVGDGLAEHAFL